MADMALTAAASEAARQDKETRRREEAARDAATIRGLQAEMDGVPKTALQYMHPELPTPEPAIVLPPITNTKFELRSNFITFVQGNQFRGESDTECPIQHIKVFLNICATLMYDNVP